MNIIGVDPHWSKPIYFTRCYFKGNKIRFYTYYTSLPGQAFQMKKLGDIQYHDCDAVYIELQHPKNFEVAQKLALVAGKAAAFFQERAIKVVFVYPNIWMRSYDINYSDRREIRLRKLRTTYRMVTHNTKANDDEVCSALISWFGYRREETIQKSKSMIDNNKMVWK